MNLKIIIPEMVQQDRKTPAPKRAEPSRKSAYREQYGVIVVCQSERNQEKLYNALRRAGYICRVVAT